MVPAAAVPALAQRSDVRSISPNRMTARTSSSLEYATGAMNVRTYNNGGTWTGLDGTGIGIAVLDSGVMWNHTNLGFSSGVSRVKAAVDLQKAGDGAAAGVKDWTKGVDASASLYPGSPSMANYEMLINNAQVNQTDMYGHGTHVASVAAGFGSYQAKDSSGIAPGANVYDVRVLSNRGYGQLSDVLAGIDWVIYHAKEFNIRVMNLSLAADSTETWQTDPLAVAVRSASAAGITVVVAAGISA